MNGPHLLRPSAVVAALLFAAPVAAQVAATAATPPEPVAFGLTAGTQFITQHRPLWGLAQTYSPDTGYPGTMNWLEGFVKPEARFTRALGSDLAARAGMSVVGTATLGEDLFLGADTGRVLLEDAYLGLAGGNAGGLRYDLSAGAQPYRLGHGLVLANGLPKETVRRKLEKLKSQGKVERLPDGRWQYAEAGVDENTYEFTRETVRKLLQTARHIEGLLMQSRPD